MHRLVALLLVTFGLSACGGSTDTKTTRYNFAVVSGMDQKATAGTPTLPQPVTSQLTRDPQGKFATRVLDFFAPAVAYAQSVGLAGEPVANQIVCGRESLPGEPKVVPLCAYTLADGKAANTIETGTKAGVYNVLFTAQVPSQAPVADSTTVTVDPGPADPNSKVSGAIMRPPLDTVPTNAVLDLFGNSVPFAIESDTLITVAGTQAGTVAARRFSFKVPSAAIHNVYTRILDAEGKQIGVFDYTLYSTGEWTWQAWGMAIAPH